MHRILAALVVLLTAVACGMPQYTKEDLSRMGVKETTGVVAKGSRGYFLLAGDAEERLFRTWQKTQYIPESYRPLDGDRIRVAYQEILARSGRAKLAVMQLEALEVAAANQPLVGPVTGTLVQRSQMFDIYVLPEGAGPGEKPLVFRVRPDAEVKLKTPRTMGTPDAQTLSDLIPLNAKVWVDFTREPILRGNGYYYKVKALREL